MRHRLLRGLPLLLILVELSPASAFAPYFIDSACTRTTSVSYFIDSTWTGTGLIDEVERALLRWETALDWNGSQVVELHRRSESTAGTHWTVTRSTDVFGVAQADCATRTVSIHPQYTDPVAVEYVLAHEAGHIFGLNHTGDDDTHDANPPLPPLMTSCYNPYWELEYRQDDEGAITRFSGDFSAPGVINVTNEPTIHANASFERGLTYWKLAKPSGGSATWSSPTSGGLDGPRYVILDPEFGTDHIYQDMSFTPRNSSNPVDWRIDGRVNHRKMDTLSTGYVTVELLVARVYYKTTGYAKQEDEETAACGLDVYLPSAQFMNYRTTVDPLVVVRGANWTTASTWQTHTLPAYAIPAEYRGTDVRIRARSGVTNAAGAMTAVAFDNVRARDVG